MRHPFIWAILGSRDERFVKNNRIVWIQITQIDKILYRIKQSECNL